MHARTTILPKVFLAAVAALLLASMAAHAVIPHEHQHFAFGEGIAAAAHGEERKLWFIALPLALLFFGWAIPQPCLAATPRLALAIAVGFDPLRLAFRRGILHRKVCG
jgi:hypothetical protein